MIRLSLEILIIVVSIDGLFFVTDAVRRIVSSGAVQPGPWIRTHSCGTNWGPMRLVGLIS